MARFRDEQASQGCRRTVAKLGAQAYGVAGEAGRYLTVSRRWSVNTQSTPALLCITWWLKSQ
jgi:hypothetical protein